MINHGKCFVCILNCSFCLLYVTLPKLISRMLVAGRYAVVSAVQDRGDTLFKERLHWLRPLWRRRGGLNLNMGPKEGGGGGGAKGPKGGVGAQAGPAQRLQVEVDVQYKRKEEMHQTTTGRAQKFEVCGWVQAGLFLRGQIFTWRGPSHQGGGYGVWLWEPGWDRASIDSGELASRGSCTKRAEVPCGDLKNDDSYPDRLLRISCCIFCRVGGCVYRGGNFVIYRRKRWSVGSWSTWASVLWTHTLMFLTLEMMLTRHGLASVWVCAQVGVRWRFSLESSQRLQNCRCVVLQVRCTS